MHSVSTIDQLLAALRPDPSPALIWYGPDGERVELSGRVLDNWVAKTANLLSEELDAEPGTVIRLAMPPHWRSVVWALAGWQTGATLTVDAAGDDGGTEPDVVVSNELDQLGDGPAYQVAVAEGALALGWPGALPEGVLDYAAEVRSYGDVFMGMGSAENTATALEYDGGSLTFDALLHREPVSRNILIPTKSDWFTTLTEVVATWLGGGTVVLGHQSVHDTAKLVANERITEQL